MFGRNPGAQRHGGFFILLQLFTKGGRRSPSRRVSATKRGVGSKIPIMGKVMPTRAVWVAGRVPARLRVRGRQWVGCADPVSRSGGLALSAPGGGGNIWSGSRRGRSGAVVARAAVGLRPSSGRPERKGPPRPVAPWGVSLPWPGASPERAAWHAWRALWGRERIARSHRERPVGVCRASRGDGASARPVSLTDKRSPLQ